MRFLKNLFRKKTVYSELKAVAEPLIIRTYRSLAARKKCAPTNKTTDEEILMVYQKVVAAFRNAASCKGEFIPATTCNYIVLHFLQTYEREGGEFFEEHLIFEIMKYNLFGLRESYKNKPISFFKLMLMIKVL